MEEQFNKLQQINQIKLKQTPQIFISLGGIVRRISWLGYVLASVVICGALYFLYQDYKNIYKNSLLEFFMSVFWWSFLSIGFAKFTKNYGEAIQEGKKSAILGLILIAVLFSCLSGFIAYLEYFRISVVFWFFISIFAFSTFLIVLLTLPLIFYWSDLVGGINIYDE